MKVLIICVFACLAVSALAQTDEQKQKVKALMDVCVKSSGVDVKLVLAARNKQFSDDEKLKDYINCMFGKLGFIKDGEIQKDVMRTKVEPAKREQATVILNKCAVKAASDKETAFNSWKCLLENAPELIQF